MSSLQVELVAADRKVWQGEADMVVARTVDGEHKALVDSGFLSVDRDKVIIIAEAVDASQLHA